MPQTGANVRGGGAISIPHINCEGSIECLYITAGGIAQRSINEGEAKNLVVFQARLIQDTSPSRLPVEYANTPREAQSSINYP